MADSMTHVIGEGGHAACGTSNGAMAEDAPTCPLCRQLWERLTGIAIDTGGDAPDPAELAKARRLQEHLNSTRRTADTVQVQAVVFKDGRRAAVARGRPYGFDAWPLDGAVFRPGETVATEGRLPNGQPCDVEFTAGGAGLPWRKRKTIRMRRTGVVTRLQIKPAESPEGTEQ